ncbi:HAD-IIIC family phosphatase [Vibrio sp. 10N.261.51.A3]|uniref:HAD-IIIC family phosphatase n=1 Tax=Vibrio sp. 10N.261.51.A3 TaxID=3229673 RepID=UPI00354D882A
MTYSVREATNDDKWTVLKWRNHLEVRAVMLTNHIIQEEEHSKWWNNTMSSDDRKLLVLESENVPIGLIIFNRINTDVRTAWWGFYLDNASLDGQKKTIAWMEAEKAALHYAGTILKLHEIYGDVVEGNDGVWLLHKKFGFIECPLPPGAESTQRNVRYIKHVWPENSPILKPDLYLFASHNTDFLLDFLNKKQELYAVFPYKAQKSNFGQYNLDLLNDKDLKTNDPSAVYCFIERIEDLLLSIYEPITETSMLSAETRIEEYILFITSIAKRGNKVFVADFAIQKSFPLSGSEKESNSKLKNIVEKWNARLYALKQTGIVEVLPYSHLVSSEGQSFSDKYWYLARGPFNSEFLNQYSQVIVGSILSSNSLTARVLVLDLDNTLWKGVIGDDGIDGISLGGDYPGNIYKDLQSLFLSLKERGFLLSICSKNTKSVALEAIESHPEMLLKQNDFVSWKINWSPKSSNIKELSSELNLGLQSFCFIDDNPAERAEVRANTPDVFVPELPEDPAEWYQFISKLPELYVQQVNESDKRRAELYKKRVDIKRTETSFTDRVEFLKSLEIKVIVENINNDNFDRTLQLFSKTNQFNTTTTRYTKQQLIDWRVSDSKKILHVKAQDKYSKDFEGVAALVLYLEDDVCIIDNFVMSCRVMGRDIEKAIISKLINYSFENGFYKLVGSFKPSNKNIPVKDLYEDCGFIHQDGEWVYEVSEGNLPPESEITSIDWKL